MPVECGGGLWRRGGSLVAGGGSVGQRAWQVLPERAAGVEGLVPLRAGMSERHVRESVHHQASCHGGSCAVLPLLHSMACAAVWS